MRKLSYILDSSYLLNYLDYFDKYHNLVQTVYRNDLLLELDFHSCDYPISFLKTIACIVALIGYFVSNWINYFIKIYMC
ncbi:hypothetical protein SDC9_128174 [bioreactor metagenome]|uniref:Uncharacterized protein n=1 Tax=bioreactor metagenome TaxID=1076179 RepID=A0A645CWP5_9ZZZZ